MSAWSSSQASSRGWNSVLTGKVMAPMREAASQHSTQSGLLGMRMATRVALPMPAASIPLASSAERASASA